MLNRFAILIIICIPLILLSQDNDGERGFDSSELADFNSRKAFDYDRKIPPPDNLLADILSSIGRAISWLFDKAIGFAVLGGLLFLLIWYILKNVSLKKSTRNKTDSMEYGITIHSTDQLINEDYDLLISNALKEGNFRLAIRFSFLKALRYLHLAGKIEWHKEKTNHDYFHEVSKEDRKLFGRILYYYEYVWYGEFEAREITYESVSGSVKKLERGRRN